MSTLIINDRIAGNHIVGKALNVILPLAGIGIMYYYETCETSCSYLSGTFLGVDLKYVGILLMATLLASMLLAIRTLENYGAIFRTFLISSAVGAEFILVRFQIINDIYCEYCLAFGACVLILFSVNFTGMNKKLMAASIAAGLLGFLLFFEGNVIPLFEL
jgi:hypothetical protein